MRHSPFADQHPLVAAQMAAPAGHTMQTAELIADVTAMPVGVFKEWPQNVIDGVYMALERLNDKAQYTGGKYELLTAEADSEDGKPFVKMVAFRYAPKVLRQ